MNNTLRQGIVYIFASWSAKLEISQSEVIDPIYRLLVEVNESPTYDGIPDLKKEIAKVYSDMLGYEYHE